MNVIKDTNPIVGFVDSSKVDVLEKVRDANLDPNDGWATLNDISKLAGKSDTRLMMMQEEEEQNEEDDKELMRKREEEESKKFYVGPDGKHFDPLKKFGGLDSEG